MPKKKTPAEFEYELKAINPSIVPQDTYIASNKDMLFLCANCGNKWYTKPNTVLRGRGCPTCGRVKVANQKRYTKEDIINKLSKVNPNIEIKGEYINSQTKIEVKCKKCDNEWKVVPASILQGTGCPKCNKRYRRNTYDFKNELNSINSQIDVLGDYTNAHDKIKAKCCRCNYIWMVEPNFLLKGGGCPICSHSQTSIIELIIYYSLVFLLGKENVANRDKSIVGKELDIYVNKYNFAIEFGAWHWHKDRINIDIEKEHLCCEAGINLFTIYEGYDDTYQFDKPQNAMLYTQMLSTEKNYNTTKQILHKICSLYGIDSNLLDEKWSDIIKQAYVLSRKKDSDIFAQELSIVNPSLRYIDGYTGSKNKVTLQCNDCGLIWQASSAYDVLHGHGCPSCSIKKVQRINSKQIICIETNTVYDSISEARRITKITTINDCLSGKTKTAGGFHWQYYK